MSDGVIDKFAAELASLAEKNDQMRLRVVEGWLDQFFKQHDPTREQRDLLEAAFVRLAPDNEMKGLILLRVKNFPFFDKKNGNNS